MSKQPKRQRTSRRPENAPKNNFLTPIIRSVSGGLRYVDEYEYEFNAFAKGRWINRSLLEVCTKEFMAQTPEYYKLAIEEGRITVNGKQISIDYILDHLRISVLVQNSNTQEVKSSIRR